MKRCTLCDVEKPEAAFPRDSRRTARLTSHCKSCRAAYNRHYYTTKAERKDLHTLMLKLDAEPASDQEVRERYERMHRQARAEGPKRCGCGGSLRLENRRRGTCEACHRKSKAAVEGRAS